MCQCQSYTQQLLDLTRFCGLFTVHKWRVLYVEV